MILIAALSVGCAATHQPSREAAIISRGERLIDYRKTRALSRQRSSSSSTATELSKEHLLEIYNGQQKIIERMEAQQRRKEEQRLARNEEDEFSDSSEGHALPLPSDISSNELLRILEKQQSLIQALSSKSPN